MCRKRRNKAIPYHGTRQRSESLQLQVADSNATCTHYTVMIVNEAAYCQIACLSVLAHWLS